MRENVQHFLLPCDSLPSREKSPTRFKVIIRWSDLEKKGSSTLLEPCSRSHYILMFPIFPNYYGVSGSHKNNLQRAVKKTQHIYNANSTTFTYKSVSLIRLSILSEIRAITVVCLLYSTSKAVHESIINVQNWSSNVSNVKILYQGLKTTQEKVPNVIEDSNLQENFQKQVTNFIVVTGQTRKMP